MKQYKTLLFDLDGVILDFNKAEDLSFHETFKKIGIIVDDHLYQTYHQINHRLWKEFEQGLIEKEEVTVGRFKLLFDKLHIAADYQKFAKEYQDGLANGMFLIEGAKEVLENVSKHYRLYAVTNGVSKTAYRRLQGTDTLKYFQDVFVSEDLHAQKPSMQYFNQVFERIEDFEALTTLLIGDSLSSDIQGANNAHIDSCWINVHQIDNHSSAKPTYIINNIKQLLDLLS